MELHIIARFHARPGQESAVEAAIRAVSVPTRAEAGCLDYQACRSTRDPALFFIHTRWKVGRPSNCTPRCRTPCVSLPPSSR